jgi:glycosyltransferase involved in cell wall biosynthesis
MATVLSPTVRRGEAPDEAKRAALADNCGKRIGILIVTYNALTTLAKVLKRIPEDVWKNVEQVVVLDDASQDSTYELAMGLKAVSGDQKLHVLRHGKNLGYGGNQKAGYQYFIEQGFDVAVLLHGDGQYAPEMLAEMYHPIVAGEADAVFGSRMMKDFGGPLKGGMPLYKYAGNKMLTAFENSILGMNLTEFHSGYRAYSMHALKQIERKHMTDDFHFDTEIIVKLNHQGFKIKEVPIPTFYGDEICYVNGLKYARDIVRAIYRYQQTRRSVKSHPEFQEYFVPYPIKQSTYSSHHMIKEAVGTGQKILDVGCGKGHLAKDLVERGNRVSGVESLPSQAVFAGMEVYAQANLFDGLEGVREKLGSGQFDKVILLDLLDRVPYPEIVLRDVHRLIKESGQLLITVPNVANITVRLALLLGRFEYQDRGILDRVHLRFFTRKSIRRLVEKSGFTIVRQAMTVIPLEVLFPLKPEHLLMRMMQAVLVFATKCFPGLLGYQSFMIARPLTGSAIREPQS